MSLNALKVFGISIIAILAPIKAMIIAAAVVTILDFIVGIIAALKRKERITSSGLKTTVVKIFVYEVALILGFIVQHYLMSDGIQVVNLAATLIGCTELKSVMENLEEIYGQPFLSGLIKMLTAKASSASDQ
jgi:FtsH-binding integral membrane protein